MVFKVGSNNIDTDDVAEGANKYYTNARAEGVSINNLSEDSTPQLGGALDVNGNNISSASSNNVVIHPNGNGQTQIKGGVELNADDEAVNVDIVRHNGTNGLMLGGVLVTSSAGELNKLDGYTGSATDLQKIADYTGTASELNVLDLNANEIVGIFKVATSVPTQASDFTGNTKIIMVY